MSTISAAAAAPGGGSGQDSLSLKERASLVLGMVESTPFVPPMFTPVKITWSWPDMQSEDLTVDTLWGHCPNNVVSRVFLDDDRQVFEGV